MWAPGLANTIEEVYAKVTAIVESNYIAKEPDTNRRKKCSEHDNHTTSNKKCSEET